MGAILSMTGYGRSEARGVRLAVLVEARALNHRFLEIGVKMPRGLSLHETEVRRLCQGRVARGRVDVTVTTRRVGGSASVVRADLTLGAEYVRGARAIGEALGLPGGFTLVDLLRLPGVVSVEEAQEDDAEALLLVKEAVQQALDGLVAMRQVEGVALGRDLDAHLGTLHTWTGALGTMLPVALERIQRRMRTRVETLLGETPVDPGRLAQEVALWAAKSDVAEELARLTSHVGQFRGLLAAGGPIGRQLDFLAQEMHREVNTIASKADDAEMIARVLEARAVVERIREQVQNVE